jgi:hypothetical protein
MFSSDPNCLENSQIDDNYTVAFLLKRDNWVLPMLGLSALNVIVILAFEVFVICKAAKDSPSRYFWIS